MINKIRIVSVFFILLYIPVSYAQIGLSVSPPRVYYEVDAGQTGGNDIIITNVGENKTLELSITLGDWSYNQYGENVVFQADTLPNSCASWVNISGPSYISLKPKESRSVRINITVPADLNDSIPVHTAMLYVTQMNPFDDVDEKGANIKVGVRSGIKLFHRQSTPRYKKIDIKGLSFDKEKNNISLEFENKGNVWLNGDINVYLFNKSSGKEVQLNNVVFYTMPNDYRITRIPIPEQIDKGDYMATVLIDYGDEYNLEAAELQFKYE